MSFRKDLESELKNNKYNQLLNYQNDFLKKIAKEERSYRSKKKSFNFKRIAKTVALQNLKTKDYFTSNSRLNRFRFNINPADDSDFLKLKDLERLKFISYFISFLEKDILYVYVELTKRMRKDTFIDKTIGWSMNKRAQFIKPRRCISNKLLDLSVRTFKSEEMVDNFKGGVKKVLIDQPRKGKIYSFGKMKGTCKIKFNK